MYRSQFLVSTAYLNIYLGHSPQQHVRVCQRALKKKKYKRNIFSAVNPNIVCADRKAVRYRRLHEEFLLKTHVRRCMSFKKKESNLRFTPKSEIRKSLSLASLIFFGMHRVKIEL